MLREVIEGYEMEIGEEHPHKLKSQYDLTPLSWAAYRGYETIVKLLLAKDSIDPDLKDSQYDRTPLSWAAENGHDTIVKLLLETGQVEADSKDEDGRTPLSWAAENGHDAVVELLEGNVSQVSEPKTFINFNSIFSSVTYIIYIL